MVAGLGTNLTALAVIGYKHQQLAVPLDNGSKLPQDKAFYRTSSAPWLHLDWRSFGAP
jgi:hypothetical protein